MAIKWTIKQAGVESTFDQTRNALYVTLANPIGPAQGAFKAIPRIYETVLDTSCKLANRYGTQDDIVNAIWSGFSDVTNPPKNVAGQPLKYYKKKDENSLLADLLKDGSGTCNAWAYFFMAAIRLQGIHVSIQTVKPKSGSGTIIIAEELPGQGNNSPSRNEFGQHQLVSISNGPTLYDPSYGVAYAGTNIFDSLQQWEDEAVVKVDGDTHDAGNSQTTITATNY